MRRRAHEVALCAGLAFGGGAAWAEPAQARDEPAILFSGQELRVDVTAEPRNGVLNENGLRFSLHPQVRVEHPDGRPGHLSDVRRGDRVGLRVDDGLVHTIILRGPSGRGQ